MKKQKFYCPETQGTFQMMFGFKQPSTYRKQKWVKVERTKKEKK